MTEEASDVAHFASIRCPVFGMAIEIANESGGWRNDIRLFAQLHRTVQ